MKKKVITSILAILICIIGVTIGIIVLNQNTKNKEEEPKSYTKIDRSKEEAEIRKKMSNPDYKLNDSAQFSLDRVYDGIRVWNISLAKMGESVYFLNLAFENITENDYAGKKVTITFIDIRGHVMARIPTEIPKLVSGGKDAIAVEIKQNVLNAYDFKIE